jgi:hypothetical protein
VGRGDRADVVQGAAGTFDPLAVDRMADRDDAVHLRRAPANITVSVRQDRELIGEGHQPAPGICPLGGGVQLRQQRRIARI